MQRIILVDNLCEDSQAGVKLLQRKAERGLEMQSFRVFRVFALDHCPVLFCQSSHSETLKNLPGSTIDRERRRACSDSLSATSRDGPGLGFEQSGSRISEGLFTGWVVVI